MIRINVQISQINNMLSPIKCGIRFYQYDRVSKNDQGGEDE